MTATEANRNFTGLTKKVDTEGIVGIEKNSKLKYVVMTKERFESMDRNVYYGRRGEELIKVEVGAERAEIFQLYPENEFHLVYGIAEVPSSAVEVNSKGGTLKVHVDLDEAPEAGRASIISSEEFMDENGESVFHPDTEFEGDQFARRNLERCKAVISEFDLTQKVYNTELSVIRNGEEQMEEYLKSIEGKDIWEPGKRTPRPEK